jgi:hypothetical protein
MKLAKSQLERGGLMPFGATLDPNRKSPCSYRKRKIRSETFPKRLLMPQRDHLTSIAPRAGIQQPASATAAESTGAAANVAGSLGET